MPAPTAHLLILSDIHIGEYVKEVDRIGYLKSASRQDEALCAFLEYHQRNRIDGLPWRLIINGDFLDFIAVTLRPDEDADLSLSEEESQWGLDSSPQKAVWKLDRLVERHRPLFTWLADFLGHGNTVEILYGNHDVEFWWTEVHDALRDHLRRIYFGGEATKGLTEEELMARVRFHRWFLYEPGRFYIEHGNQYDDFSSFEHRLHPVAPDDPQQLAMPVSHLAIRYFVNQYKGFRSHNKDNWTILDFLRWLHQQGRENLAWIFKLYVTLTARVLGYARRSRASDDDELRQIHARELSRLADQTGMPLETLQKVDALRNAPVTRSMGRTLQLVGADRAALTLAWAALIFLAWVIPLPLAWTLGAWAACGLGLWLSHKLLPWARDRYLGGRVTTQVWPKVDAAAAALAQHLDVRYIVFGHTHKPRKVRVRASPPCDYLNSGSWLAPRARERHEHNQPCPSRLTFIACRDGDAPDARLFRWCTRDNLPLPFDPRVGLEGLEPEHPEDLAPTTTRQRDRPGPLRGRRPAAERRGAPRSPYDPAL